MDSFDLYHRRCRLCASEHNLGLNLFESEGALLDLKSKIEMYLSIDVSADDELPKRMCYQCLYRIETFHSFRQSCIEAEHTLRNWHLFYGEFGGKQAENTTESDSESTAKIETIKIVSAKSQDMSNLLSDGTKLLPSVSVESVAKPTENSLSTMKLAEIAETAIKSKHKSGKLHSKTDKSSTMQPSYKSPQKSHLSNSSGKIDIVAVKNGRNVVRISSDGQDIDSKEQSSNIDNSEVSRILLNMSGVGTISVTKFEGAVMKEKTSKNKKVREGGKRLLEKHQVADYVTESDDEEGSDGFSGFDFGEGPVQSNEEFIKTESGEMLNHAMVMGELVPSECIQFEHLELEENGDEVHKNESTVVEDSDNKEPLSYMMITVDSSGSTRFACIKCNKTFAQKSYIKEHMKIHTGEKPFMCTICGRSFRNNYMLKVHFRLHTGEKNFKCEECGALFTERGALVSHSRTHTGIKPFVCKFCDRKFAQNPALKRHLRIHTKEKPFTCEHCDTSFADRGTWRNHIRTHTGERPYDCTLCGKSFVQRTNLQAHIKTHTDERPFPCQVCGSSFRTKAHLVKHLSTIHRDVMKSVVTFMKDP